MSYPYTIHACRALLLQSQSFSFSAYIQLYCGIVSFSFFTPATVATRARAQFAGGKKGRLMARVKCDDVFVCIIIFFFLAGALFAPHV